jgi:hypothetical protein
MSIRDQLIRRIGENIGNEYIDDIANAFEASVIEDKLMGMVDQNQIDLRDDKNNLLL